MRTDDGLEARPDLGTVQLRAESAGGDGRTIDIRLLDWDSVARTEDGPELFARGAFDDAQAGMVTIESQRHGGPLVGRGIEIDPAEPRLTARISETAAGDELLTLVRDGVIGRASIVFAQPPGGYRTRPDGVTERRRVDLRRVAILERGSHPGAVVLAVRRETDMDGEQQQQQAPAAPPAPVVDLVPLTDRLGAIEQRMGELAVFGRADTAPLQYRADTLGQLLFASWEDRELRRALADQITTDNPGLVHPAVLTRAALIISRGRPTIDGIGAGALPADGMSIQWPVLTTPMTGLIAKQTAEKAAVVSAKVSFGNATATIQTFAGASDVSYQLIRRSSPSYLEQYSRVMLAAWAHVVDQQFVTDLAAGATGGSVIITAASNAAAIVAALVDASLKVQVETGEPASFVGVAPDLFAAIAKAYAPTSLNPTNAGGTAMASTLRVNVSGLEITNDPFLPAGTGLVTNSTAAEWLEDGPFQITVDDAEKIGQNVAYWSLGVSAIYAPKGIVKIAAA